MFVIKMVSRRDQFKARPRPDWTPLGFHSSFTTSVLLLLTTEFIPPPPPTPSCEVTLSLVVLLGLLDSLVWFCQITNTSGLVNKTPLVFLV